MIFFCRKCHTANWLQKWLPPRQLPTFNYIYIYNKLTNKPRIDRSIRNIKSEQYIIICFLYEDSALYLVNYNEYLKHVWNFIHVAFRYEINIQFYIWISIQFKHAWTDYRKPVLSAYFLSILFLKSYLANK